MHKELICHHSHFFRGAFSGGFEEAEAGAISLPEDDVEVFKVFERWLYTEDFHCSTGTSNVYLHLAKVYCFGDKVGIRALKHGALDALRENVLNANDVPIESDLTNFVWQNTVAQSSLRKLLVDLFTYRVAAEDVENDILAYPTEFIADVTILNMKRLQYAEDVVPYEHDATQYYECDGTSSTRRLRNDTVGKLESEGAPKAANLILWQTDKKPGNSSIGSKKIQR